MSKRIVFTFATGQPQFMAMAEGLGLSIAMHHSQTERVLITDHKPGNSRADRLLPLAFDRIIPPPKNFKHFFIKLCALQETDADQILFIDGDGFALKNIDPIFDELAGTKFAVQGAWRNDFKTWYGDINSVMKKRGLESIPHFSGGFMYYERTPETQVLIDAVMALSEVYDEIGVTRPSQHAVDEICISLAMAETKIGEVVPMSRDYSVTPWMSQSKKRLDVAAGECSFVKLLDRPYAFNPYIYHTAATRWDLAYWRELNKILKMHDNVLQSDMHRDVPEVKHKLIKRIAVKIYRKMIGI